MYTILKKQELSSGVKLFAIDAPLVANKCLPGQFVILRIDEDGERIPLTIADFDREAGTITLIFQEVGHSTRKLGALAEGDALRDWPAPWASRLISAILARLFVSAAVSVLRLSILSPVLLSRPAIKSY